MQHYTTIEQSKKLVELGLNPLTSDMSYSYDFDDSRYETSTTPVKNWIVPKYAESTKIQQVLPCWSLGALLELMPIIDDSTYKLYGTLNKGAVCEHPCTSVMFQEESPLDAAFNMVVWLLENGYIKKGE